jgi:hypothetical protein
VSAEDHERSGRGVVVDDERLFDGDFPGSCAETGTAAAMMRVARPKPRIAGALFIPFSSIRVDG